MDLLVTVFIVIWMIFTVTWCLPKGSFLYGVSLPISRFVIWSGLWHGWGMFMNPPTANRRFLAVIEYTDGVVEEWDSLACFQGSLWKSMLAARTGKLEEVQLRANTHYLHPATAEYLSRRVADPHRTVKKIRLLRLWKLVAEPGELPPDAKPWNRYQMFEWSPRGAST